MGVSDFVNYVIYDNPVSKTVKSFVIPTKLPVLPPQQITVVTETKPLWQMASENGGAVIRVAGLFGASAVALGAYGAHRTYPKDRADDLKALFELANRIHYFHTLALLGVPLCKHPRVTGSLICLGILCFSGPLYYHAFSGDDTLKKITPFGGSILIIGWLSMVL